MRYTGSKNKLCRREGINLFWPQKYDIKKNRKLPGQHGANNVRYSEYGKLLRNKQVLKRIYQLSERQFKKTVIDVAGKFAKSQGVAQDKLAFQFLERRLDVTILRAGFAHTIMQARQMVTHAHFTLNGTKHNIPSYFVKAGDVVAFKAKLHNSPLVQTMPLQANGNHVIPSWLKVNKKTLEIEVVDMPNNEEVSAPVDLLQVIEFYARA